MVGNTNHRGLRDWLAQRVTAILIAAYTFFIIGYLVFSQTVDFTKIHTLFSSLWVKVATVLVVLSILWHAWIGLWTVMTDYVKPKLIRLTLETLVLLVLFAYLIWVIEIFWG